MLNSAMQGRAALRPCWNRGCIVPDSGRKLSCLYPGDHTLCLYETEDERWDVLLKYIIEGIENGERINCFVDKETADSITHRLIDAGIDARALLEKEILAFLTDRNMFVRKGVFDPFDAITFLHIETERAMADGYTALRVVQEMQWGLQGLKDGTLEGYDHQLNVFISEGKCSLMCIYDLNRYDPGLLSEILSMHPLVCAGHEVYENLYYRPPPDPMDPNPEITYLRYRLNNLMKYKPHRQ